MTLADLLNICRSRLDDTVEPYLWSDDELLSYANKTLREVCRRTKCLRDDSLVITTIIGEADYKLPDYVLEVTEVQMMTNDNYLIRLWPSHKSKIGCYYQTYMGLPQRYLTDAIDGYLSFFPTPNLAVSMVVGTIKLPQKLLATSNTFAPLPIPMPLHDGVENGMLANAYLKNDTDTANISRAQYYAQLFDTQFGTAMSANALMQKRNGLHRNVRARFS